MQVCSPRVLVLVRDSHSTDSSPRGTTAVSIIFLPGVAEISFLHVLSVGGNFDRWRTTSGDEDPRN
jgi:hypothetical protein